MPKPAKKVWLWTEFAHSRRPTIEVYELVSSNAYGVKVRLYGEEHRVPKSRERTFIFDYDALVEKYRRFLSERLATARREIAAIDEELIDVDATVESAVRVRPATPRPRPKPGWPDDAPETRKEDSDG